jgi:hypothetical protein
MRKSILAAAAGAAIVFNGAADAQLPSAQAPATSPAPPPAGGPRAPSAAPAIKSVSIIDIEDLQEAAKTQVNQAVATRTADQLQKLRNAIEAAPALKSALEAKGLSSRDVVVAQIDDDGELTIVTKKMS